MVKQGKRGGYRIIQLEVNMDKLISAIVEAQKKISDANRSATNEYFKSSKNKSGSPYATLEDVIQAVKEPLLEQGVLYQQISEQVEGGVCIETVFIGHGSKLETGKIFVPADKQTPHGYGSALTYARRYSLSLACGIGAADDDANKAEETVKKVAKKAPVKEVRTNEDDKYLFINQDGNLISSADTEETFLELCRSFLKKPDEDNCKTLYQANKTTISKAHIASVNDTKKAFTGLINLYEEKDNG